MVLWDPGGLPGKRRHREAPRAGERRGRPEWGRARWAAPVPPGGSRARPGPGVLRGPASHCGGLTEKRGGGPLPVTRSGPFHGGWCPPSSLKANKIPFLGVAALVASEAASLGMLVGAGGPWGARCGPACPCLSLLAAAYTLLPRSW